MNRVRFAMKNLPYRKSIQISVRDALFTAAPIGFIVLCESIRNEKKRRSPVQRLHASVNHRMVQCVRPTAKIFTVFTRID